MFTGAVTNLGKLTGKDGAIFTFNTDSVFCRKINIATSIAVNGVCLTVFKKPAKTHFSVEVIPETLDKTTLSSLRAGDLVNLESPATPQSFLSGHIVQGHIDGTAKLEKITKQENSHILKFSIPSSLSKYIVQKGSIAINGISLTVIDAKKDHFTAAITPYTWTHTMLQNLKIGSFVNIEVDILAKYLERLTRK